MLSRLKAQDEGTFKSRTNRVEQHYLHGPPVVRKERDDISQQLVLLATGTSLVRMYSKASSHEVACCELNVP